MTVRVVQCNAGRCMLVAGHEGDHVFEGPTKPSDPTPKQEPVAWRFRLHEDGIKGQWTYLKNEPHADVFRLFEVQPLFTSPQESELREALKTALSQWELYADMSRDHDGTYLASATDDEAKLFRKVRAALAAEEKEECPSSSL